MTEKLKRPVKRVAEVRYDAHDKFDPERYTTHLDLHKIEDLEELKFFAEKGDCVLIDEGEFWSIIEYVNYLAALTGKDNKTLFEENEKLWSEVKPGSGDRPRYGQ